MSRCNSPQLWNRKVERIAPLINLTRAEFCFRMSDFLVCHDDWHLCHLSRWATSMTFSLSWSCFLTLHRSLFRSSITWSIFPVYTHFDTHVIRYFNYIIPIGKYSIIRNPAYPLQFTSPQSQPSIITLIITKFIMSDIMYIPNNKYAKIGRKCLSSLSLQRLPKSLRLQSKLW